MMVAGRLFNKNITDTPLDDRVFCVQVVSYGISNLSCLILSLFSIDDLRLGRLAMMFAGRLINNYETGITIPNEHRITPTIFHVSSAEKDVSDIDTGETEAEEIWYPTRRPSIGG